MSTPIAKERGICFPRKNLKKRVFNFGYFLLLILKRTDVKAKELVNMPNT